MAAGGGVGADRPVLPVLLGITGLVIDGGLLLVASRRAQNAADAAAMAAAIDLMSGRPTATARETARTYVRTHNRLAGATVTVQTPPSQGPYQGNPRYVEVIVGSPVRTVLIQALGVNRDHTVRRLAVAGFDSANNGAGVMMLDPDARPGFRASGNGSLRVNGTVIVNSDGGGVDEHGRPIGNGNSGSAISLSGNASLEAIDVLSVGGLASSGNSGIEDYLGQRRNPLKTRQAIASDPLVNLPVPTTANGAIANFYPAVRLSGNQSAVLEPGVYPSISLSGGASAYFRPGIYIITGGGMSLSGNGSVMGEGVLIYNTGSDYNVHTGLPDANDRDNPPPAAGRPDFGSVSMSGNGHVQFSPIEDPSSPFNGLGFYQRRLNTEDLRISGNGEISPFRGSIYAKWADLTLSGTGRFASQFVVRSVTLSGNATITVDATGQQLAGTHQMFLVQ